jgi:hypothetical protein
MTTSEKMFDIESFTCRQSFWFALRQRFGSRLEKTIALQVTRTTIDDIRQKAIVSFFLFLEAGRPIMHKQSVILKLLGIEFVSAS